MTDPPTEVHQPSPGGNDIWAWLKRTFWGSRRRKITTVVLASLLVLVAVAGIADALHGGSSPEQSPGASLEPASLSQQPSHEAVCTTGPASHNMRATFYGASSEACTQLNQEVAKTSGEFWRVVPTGNYVEGSELVCSMAKGSELVEVRDTGEHDYGNQFCAGLTAKGWTEHEGPGEKAEKERKVEQEKQTAEARATEEREQEERKHRERPKLEAAAVKLRREAASLHKQQRHEEALKADDDAEANSLKAEAKRVEAEEPAEGGGNKDTEAGEIETRASEYESKAGEHESSATSYEGEAQSKENEANEDEKKASED